MIRGEVRVVGLGKEGSSSLAAGHGNGSSGARASDNLTVDRGVETVDGLGRGCGMMVEGSSSWAFEDSSAKGFRP